MWSVEQCLADVSSSKFVKNKSLSALKFFTKNGSFECISSLIKPDPRRDAPSKANLVVFCQISITKQLFFPGYTSKNNQSIHETQNNTNIRKKLVVYFTLNAAQLITGPCLQHHETCKNHFISAKLASGLLSLCICWYFIVMKVACCSFKDKHTSVME